MDPNATLARMRQAIADALTDDEDTDNESAALEVVELAAALDGWLTIGGFLPDAWKGKDA